MSVSKQDQKKIIVTENVSSRDTLHFKKNNYYSSDFKYSDIANRQHPVSANSHNQKPYKIDFSNLNKNNPAHCSTKSKPKFNSSFPYHLSTRGHNCLIYADDMVLVSSNKLLNVAITFYRLGFKVSTVPFII